MEKKTAQLKNEIEKFVISKEHSLIDIIRRIEKTDADKVILTFTEPTDVLVSPINLKVILDTADESGKSLVAQIVQNPIGVRNAKESGMTVTEATGSIMDEYWNDAEKSMRRRTRDRDDKLHNSNLKIKEVEQSEEIFVEPDEEKGNEDPYAIPLVEEKSEFQKKIEATLEKAKANMMGKGGKVVEENGLKLAIDQDIEETNINENNSMSPVTREEIAKNKKQASLIGRDIAFINDLPDEDIEVDVPTKNQPRPVQVSRKALPSNKILAAVLKLGESISKAPLKKILIRLVAPLLAVLVIALWIVYEFTPLVKTTIYIESKAVSVEKVFNGDTKVNDFNYELGVVPVKKEEATKSTSGTVTPTGVAYRGNKAEGIVTLKYWDFALNGGKSTTVAAGTVITSTSGQKFEITSNTTVGNPDNGAIFQDTSVRALAVGEEYNLAAGQTFTVHGYTETQMIAENKAAFSGGSKEQYTVLSKGDVDKVVKEIKGSAIDEVKGDLNSRADNGWAIIDSTLKADLDGDAKTDIAIGAEADVVNVTINIKGTAMYFKKGDLETKMNEVLTKAAQDQNLFSSDNNIKLEMDSNIEKEITVEEVKGDTAKIKIVARGIVKPKIDKNDLVKDLKGKSWEDGKKVLNKVSYTDKKSEATFQPSYFPEWLRYFPERQGRILISVKEIVE